MKRGKVTFISTTYKGLWLEGHTMCPLQRTCYFQLILNYIQLLEGFDNTQSQGVFTLKTLITWAIKHSSAPIISLIKLFERRPHDQVKKF